MKKQIRTVIYHSDETEKYKLDNFAEKRGFRRTSAYFMYLYVQDRNKHKDF